MNIFSLYIFYMLSLNPRSDCFLLIIGDSFFSEKVTAKYDKYLSNQPNFFTSAVKLVNESIQKISLPGLNQEFAVQKNFIGGTTPVNTNYPSYESSPNELESNILSITFRMCDAYMNWFIMFEQYKEYYGTVKKSQSFDLPIMIFNQAGQYVFTFTYLNVLFKSIASLDLDYTKITRDADNFVCSFSCDDYKVEFTPPTVASRNYIPTK